MKVSVLVIILTLSCAGVAHSQSNGQALAGAGTLSCGKYLALKSDPTAHLMFVSWAQGFLSGMNMADFVTTRRRFVLLPDGDSIMAYMDRYCRDNPLKSSLQGSMQLYKELRSNENR
jgi:hypothetical protein